MWFSTRVLYKASSPLVYASTICPYNQPRVITGMLPYKIIKVRQLFLRRLHSLKQA